MALLIRLLSATLAATLPCAAAVLKTSDGLSLQAALPGVLSGLALDGKPVAKAGGGLVLIDPKTGQSPEAGCFTLTATGKSDGRRLVIAGMVKAAGDQETVCELQARIPVGESGWLFWDDVTRSRPIAESGVYRQDIYPLECVTSPDRKLGVAVGVDPDPVQPTVISYDRVLNALVISWQFGFSPLAAPPVRMQAPFRFEVYRTQPDGAFRSALAGYYSFHPKQFDWRARYEGMWLFASPADSLPNPQHYAYNEGGPPTTADKPRGIHTFPYTCTGDLTIPLPVEWGTPKTYQEMLDRLARWEKIPRVLNWERLTSYDIDGKVVHSGTYSMKFVATEQSSQQVRQNMDLNQKQLDPVTVSVWTKADNVTGDKNADYGLWLDMEMTDGTTQFGKIVPADPGTHDWQQLKLTVGEDKPIRQIRLYLLLRGKHTGTTWWDDVSVTAASAPNKNLVLSPGFESAGPPPEAAYLRANVMTDEKDQMRYHADTWGGADVALASPINWLRFGMLVSPDQKATDGIQTEAEKDLARMDGWFLDSPDCAGNYMDGTSAGCTTSWEYRRDHLYAFTDPLMYRANVYRPCGNGMASVIRYVNFYKQRYPGKLAFGNVWASTRMFPISMALDVPGYESSRWYDLAYADYYRAAACRKPGLYLNYFRIGQQLDTRDGGEKFFRYSTAYGLFPSIGRFTGEAYEKFGDLQHLYVPIVRRLFRAGWEPVSLARTADPVVRVERYGTKLPVYFTVLNPTDNPRVVTLTIRARALGLPAGLAAVEMSTSAALPLQAAGGDLSTDVTLGPQDVAVVVLMPQQDLGAWYRGRAAEILQGASYVYASTPPTNATATLAKQLAALSPKLSAAELAKQCDTTIAAIEGLMKDSATLPDDLKQRSYRRDLEEAQRLLGEALLADTGARVCWTGQPVAAIDGEVAPQAKLLAPGGAAQVTQLQFARERLVEPAGLSAAPKGPLQPLALRLTDRTKPSVTLLATVSLTDAVGGKHELPRRGYAYFGPISEMTATYEPAGATIAVRLRNADTRPRTFKLALTAPRGLQLAVNAVDLSLAPGESRDVPIKVTFAAGLQAGSYFVKVTASVPEGLVVDEAQVAAPYVTPLESGDLALTAAGAQVAVDSAYYAYSAKPLNDGIIQPTGTFNEAAWAAAETPDDHWIQLTWPTAQTVARVVVYWNIEDGATWSPQHVLVQAKTGAQWRGVAGARLPGPEPATALTFASVTTTALRIVQPKGEGPMKRPNIMWVREVAAYGK